MVVCLECSADLHMAQLMPLPLVVCQFSKIQIGLTFLVPAHPGSPGKRAVKRVCVCVCEYDKLCVNDSQVKSESLTPVLRKSVITPRTPTPFKNALASFERQSGSVRVLVSICVAVTY